MFRYHVLHLPPFEEQFSLNRKMDISFFFWVFCISIYHFIFYFTSGNFFLRACLLLRPFTLWYSYETPFCSLGINQPLSQINNMFSVSLLDSNQSTSFTSFLEISSLFAILSGSCATARRWIMAVEAAEPVFLLLSSHLTVSLPYCLSLSYVSKHPRDNKRPWINKMYGWSWSRFSELWLLLDELILLTPERCQFIQDHVPVFCGGGISDLFASILTHPVCVCLVILY